MAKLYVASSWRNEHYIDVTQRLRGDGGHEIWDWRCPPTGGNGFRWQDCGQEDYQPGDKLDPEEWKVLLQHPIAQAGFASDLAGMYWCDIGVMLHPCGRSAHLEAATLAAWGKKVHVLALEPVEPDLMILLLGGKIFSNLNALVWELSGL